ncbi:hypothetical protein [Pseudokineococcus marinus]|uniref:Peptidase C-terminal archaeal/bacterial domain-containing protein n=1 Tax=Pseudokineococcus marinus TaxID=351215 RepID=A0A849BLD4_9ACTN|nr:hypothetical protein [Pseudokineococcus marinus]NNH21612.1 hypothetical protein [Pseudokineococcus marinus]
MRTTQEPTTQKPATPVRHRAGRRTVAAVAVALAALGGTTAAAQAASGPSRVAFSAGATSAPVTGQVAAGGEDAHVFGARAGQAAVVHFEGPADSYWTLVGPDGSPLHTGATEQQEDATVALPRTGDYVLDVHSATAGSYELDLTIPQPIRFAPGGTSRTVRGAVSPSQGELDAYSFGARAGQEATVRFSSDTGGATWSLVAPDGSPLHTGMTQDQSSATVRLPSSGTYSLDVQSDAGPTGYALTLSIPAR